MRARRWPAIAIAAGIALTSCVSPLPPASPSPMIATTSSPADDPTATPSTTPTDARRGPSLDPTLTIGRLVQCGAEPPAFAAELLLQPGSAEAGLDEPAELLRAFVRESPPESDLPAGGWIRVEAPPTTILFIAPAADGWSAVRLNRAANGWLVDLGGQCALRPMLPKGVNGASWWVDPLALPLDATTTHIPALVMEHACASGQAPVGRILGPVIDDQPERVIVTFAVRAQVRDQDCPSNPPLGVPFDLPTPLGARPLLDGGEIPPRDATVSAG